MNIWFTSDTHFGHQNIIQYAHRPFKDVEHMNKVLITNWNNRIKKNDLVFHLGDFCFKNSPGGKEGEGETKNAEYYLSQLNGHITFIRGNHDRNNSLNAIIKNGVIEFGGEEIYITHDPLDAITSYKINLVGHVHDLWKIKKEHQCYIINVGVDVWGWYPININEIMKLIAETEKK